MRRVNDIILNLPGNVNQNGFAIDANQLINIGLQAIGQNDDEAGTIQVQGSNDAAPQGVPASAFTPTNWSNLTGATIAVAAGAGPMLQLSNVACRWIRVTWTHTSGGTGVKNIVVQMFAQGI